MADRYIDYFEVGEYGDHFVSESKKLDGLSPLVDVPAVRAAVQATIDAVDAELAKIGVRRSELRTGRTSVTAATADAKDLIGRFYYSLLGLPKSAGVDVEAFYPGKKLGELADLKPADVSGKLGAVRKGFAAPANAAAAAHLGTWDADLAVADKVLTLALGDKGGATGTSITATAALKAARESFLRAYNKVAKHLVSGLLAHLGREEEYELFFKDLTVNEGATKAAAPAGKSDP